MDKLNQRALWLNELRTATTTEEPFYKTDKCTNLFLPVRIEGKRLLMVSEPTPREILTVVFDEWDWNEPRVHEILVYLTEEIKQVTLGMGFKLPKIHYIEKDELWTLRTQGDKTKLQVWKYFKADH
jgi:hypothetical protein